MTPRLETVEEAFSDRIAVCIADTADRRERVVVGERLGVVRADILVARSALSRLTGPTSQAICRFEKGKPIRALRRFDASLSSGGRISAAPADVRRGFWPSMKLVNSSTNYDVPVASQAGPPQAPRQPCTRCGWQSTAARPQWLAQGIPRAAMSPAASGGRIIETVTEEDF
jgi:hypothetical protein